MMRPLWLMAAALAASTLGFTGESRADSLVARIDVSTQTMRVIRYGEVIHTWRVSTAGRGYVTPAGSWRPKRLHRMWHSRKYDMSPMPYAVFYNGGYAVHGTSSVSRLGTPASHGCVRLDTGNAAKFYALVKEIGPGNTRIVVQN